MLLKHAGFQPYLLRHGSGREMYHLVLLRLDEAETKALETAINTPLQAIPIGTAKWIALPLEPQANIGEIDAKYYNAGQRRWTASIALTRLP